MGGEKIFFEQSRGHASWKLDARCLSAWSSSTWLTESEHIVNIEECDRMSKEVWNGTTVEIRKWQIVANDISSENER